MNEQKRLFTEAQYVACRSKDEATAPLTTWHKVIGVTHMKTQIPGTSTTLASTAVRVQLGVDSVSVPITAHMFYQDGSWRWSMTQQNVDGCSKTK